MDGRDIIDHQSVSQIDIYIKERIDIEEIEQIEKRKLDRQIEEKRRNNREEEEIIDNRIEQNQIEQ